jgi:hypothetical protein
MNKCPPEPKAIVRTKHESEGIRLGKRDWRSDGVKRILMTLYLLRRCCLRRERPEAQEVFDGLAHVQRLTLD